MIKWQSNFNIPDSTVQAAETLVIIESYKNLTSSCVVEFFMTDGHKVIIDDKEHYNVIKRYTRTFDSRMDNEDQIYEAELSRYEDAEIV